ncbi:MAG: rhodanese-like domain-containing protein [Firmicutes bacterium]|nr:rhodanese-like domain-containing protein [Bacillota bacterium]
MSAPFVGYFPAQGRTQLAQRAVTPNVQIGNVVVFGYPRLIENIMEAFLIYQEDAQWGARAAVGDVRPLDPRPHLSIAERLRMWDIADEFTRQTGVTFNHANNRANMQPFPAYCSEERSTTATTTVPVAGGINRLRFFFQSTEAGAINQYNSWRNHTAVNNAANLGHITLRKEGHVVAWGVPADVERFFDILAVIPARNDEAMLEAERAAREVRAIGFVVDTRLVVATPNFVRFTAASRQNVPGNVFGVGVSGNAQVYAFRTVALANQVTLTGTQQRQGRFIVGHGQPFVRWFILNTIEIGSPSLTFGVEEANLFNRAVEYVREMGLNVMTSADRRAMMHGALANGQTFNGANATLTIRGFDCESWSRASLSMPLSTFPGVTNVVSTVVIGNISFGGTPAIVNALQAYLNNVVTWASPAELDIVATVVDGGVIQSGGVVENGATINFHWTVTTGRGTNQQRSSREHRVEILIDDDIVFTTEAFGEEFLHTYDWNLVDIKENTHLTFRKFPITLTSDEAYEKMNASDDVIVLDVRTWDEFLTFRIDGALFLPYNEMTYERAIAIMPDKDATILIYCRSGRRSVIAAIALEEFGFTNIYEFGGIDVPLWPFDNTAYGCTEDFCYCPSAICVYCENEEDECRATYNCQCSDCGNSVWDCVCEVGILITIGNEYSIGSKDWRIYDSNNNRLVLEKIMEGMLYHVVVNAGDVLTLRWTYDPLQIPEGVALNFINHMGIRTAGWVGETGSWSFEFTVSHFDLFLGGIGIDFY